MKKSPHRWELLTGPDQIIQQKRAPIEGALANVGVE